MLSISQTIAGRGRSAVLPWLREPLLARFKQMEFVRLGVNRVPISFHSLGEPFEAPLGATPPPLGARNTTLTKHQVLVKS